MNTRKAYALVLAGAGIIAAGADCGKGSDGTGGAGAGPTDLNVTWTFSGMPATADACTAHMGVQVFVNLSGTTKASLHQSVTEACATGTVKFPGLQIDDLGMPYLEGRLLDDKGHSITEEGVLVTPTAGTTKVNIDFYPIKNMGGASGASSSSKAVSSSSKAVSSSSSAASSSSSSSSSSGMGGAPADAGSD